MKDKISTLKGMTPELQAKLEEKGIRDTQHLLDQTATEKQRADLAHAVGVKPQVLKEFHNRADLMRLKGVGGDLSNLLEEAGVNSCKELRHRKAESLHEALVKIQAEKKIAHHTPTLAQITEWIKEAESFSHTAE